MSPFELFCVAYAFVIAIPFADTLSNVWGLERRLAAARSTLSAVFVILLCALLGSTYPAVLLSRVFVTGFVISALRVQSVTADYVRYPLQASAVYVILDLLYNW